MSEPFEKEVRVSGNLSGEMTVAINKKDFDFGLVLYELTPEGSYFQLSYFMGRASYSQDMGERKLLVPGEKISLPFDRSRFFSRQLQKGSRLVVSLNVIKNPFSQINYGTGKDVSQESIHDAGEPLVITWYPGSFVEIGMSDPIATDQLLR